MITSEITAKNSTNTVKTLTETNARDTQRIATIEVKRKSASMRKAERPNYRLRLL